MLEKHSQIVSLHGAALVILPSASRIFDQFGVLEKIKSATTPIANEYIRWPDGSVNIEPRTMRTMPSRFGLQTLLVDRQRCVEHLYESLPDKSFIRTSTRVERIEHTESGVKVHLADGTIEEGDLVVGADGVHSLTRELMWDWAAENDPSCIPDSDKKALFTSYKGIYGVSDHAKLRDIGPSDIHVCLGHGVTKLLFTQPEKAMWAIVFKDEYSQPPKRYKADEQETEAIVARFKDLQITSNLTFNDLWTTRNRHGLIAVEEGVLSKWHAGRIVLVGDSAHKVRSISNVECS